MNENSTPPPARDDALTPGSSAPGSSAEDVRARLAAAGLSLDDLRAANLLPEPSAPAAPLGERTVATLIDRGLAVLARDQAGSHRTWAPYLSALAKGLDDLCACACAACAAGPCRCQDSVHDPGCAAPGGEAVDCRQRYRGVGDRDVDSLVRDDVTELVWWVRRRALKRTVARNVGRRERGLPEHLADGRGAAEAAIQGLRWWFRWLQDNEVTDRNPALRVPIPARQERPARSLDPAEFLEVYRTAVTTGRDPELDGLLLRHQLIHAVRRGGLLSAVAGGVDATNTTVTYWDQKRQTHRSRPSTRAHVAHLVAHMLERGPRVPAPPDAPPEQRRTGLPAIADTDPVFYRRPVDIFDAAGNFERREVRPVTRKHVETLFTRIKRHLPWAAQQGLRPHDIRHTSGRIVYKASDQQMARLHLAQDAATTTDHYLTEHLQELARLKESLFGWADADPEDD